MEQLAENVAVVQDSGAVGVDDLERLRAGVQRKPPPAKFGAIDVGTNSIHLVMVEISPEGDFHILGRDKDMVRLGEGGFARHLLTERAMSDGLAALTRFSKMAALKGVYRLRAVATSAVREARNGGDFVEKVRDALGLPIHVITPEEEARLIYLAVRHAVDLGAAENLIVDIGGGSVELIVGNAERPETLLSVKLGSTRLAELYLKSDPPAIGELKSLRRHLERQLRPLLTRIGQRTFARFIATSGTAENIAIVCAHRRGAKDIDAGTQLRVSRQELKDLQHDLSGTKRDQRAKIDGMDPQRLDSILPGAILLNLLLKHFDLPGLEYCDMALREGIILDHIAHQRAHLRARATWPDPRTRSVIQLAERCGYRSVHAEQVARLAESLFDQLTELHGLDPRYRELLRYGCLLHDIGYLIAHRGHHKHSYYLICNGGLKGFDEQEIELIANLARYHRKGKPKKSHYSYENLAPADRRVLRKLVPLLRLANALDRTHYSVVESVNCQILPDGVRVRVHTDKDAELELWMANRQSDFFAAAYDRPLEICLDRPETEETPDADDAATDDLGTDPEAARLPGPSDHR